MTSSTKEELSNTIKIMGIDTNEIEVDITLGGLFFNTVELVPEEDKIILHYFEDNYDYEFDFDDFDEENQKQIYNLISITLLN